uniref:Uncharacterized protein n=1 Tax=Lotharella oceanica TaxID=641309 RepID=A0A7S2X9A4_9EUKA|mmetsp:Transcript_15352/g.29168  ORF Transcript_15352/g.29168 Transcript_15352/m.29168 type:complete len:156 (+) Transcript_15352:641-1108(+)
MENLWGREDLERRITKIVARKRDGFHKNDSKKKSVALQSRAKIPCGSSYRKETNRVGDISRSFETERRCSSQEEKKKGSCDKSTLCATATTLGKHLRTTVTQQPGFPPYRSVLSVARPGTQLDAHQYQGRTGAECTRAALKNEDILDKSMPQTNE